MAPHRSGFVGIIGRPNVGKSTILNYYLQEKVAIVSPKPQTTRRRILGALTLPEVQVMFLDSPGLRRPEHALGRYMLESARAVLEEADVVLAVFDARTGITDEDRRVVAQIRQALRQGGAAPRTAIAAINKVDAVKKPLLLPMLEQCAKANLFVDCVPVSAQQGDQMGVLLERIIRQLPEGPQWYEPDQRTDQTRDERIRELIREPILLATVQEVPHAVAILVDHVQDQPHLISIDATIFVERPGQKAIIIGRGGAMLKQIGQTARREIERILGRKVYLGLWVKVAEHWRSDERMLRQLGYST